MKPFLTFHSANRASVQRIWHKVVVFEASWLEEIPVLFSQRLGLALSPNPLSHWLGPKALV